MISAMGMSQSPSRRGRSLAAFLEFVMFLCHKRSSGILVCGDFLRMATCFWQRPSKYTRHGDGGYKGYVYILYKYKYKCMCIYVYDMILYVIWCNYTIIATTLYYSMYSMYIIGGYIPMYVIFYLLSLPGISVAQRRCPKDFGRFWRTLRQSNMALGRLGHP